MTDPRETLTTIYTLRDLTDPPAPQPQPSAGEGEAAMPGEGEDRQAEEGQSR